VHRSGHALADWLSDVTLFPQTLINVRLPSLAGWQAHGGLARARAEVERELGDAGRVLIRASGTEPVLRVMVEARDAALAQRCAEHMASAVQVAEAATG
jgi:phosphoglucosamine mutase